MITTAVIIPFRDRGTDPLRKVNLDKVVHQWSNMHPATKVVVCSDGREGDAQFNRSAAYNRGCEQVAADVYVFAESDILISRDQVDEAILLAWMDAGMVVPFTEYRYLSKANSEMVTNGSSIEAADVAAQWAKRDSIGALGVASRRTLKLVGRWDETFEGNWYDDDAMKIAFEMTSNPYRFVEGPAHHLYHLPGWQGKHLTAADKMATAKNKRRLRLYQEADSPGRIRGLTAGVE